MIKLTQTGIGTKDSFAIAGHEIYDSTGSSMLPVQAGGDGVASFRVMGRVASDAPWFEIKAAGTAGFLESIAWVPQLQLEVLSGTGAVSLWIGEK